MDVREKVDSATKSLLEAVDDIYCPMLSLQERQVICNEITDQIGRHLASNSTEFRARMRHWYVARKMT